jgi:hypothetical protein
MRPLFLCAGGVKPLVDGNPEGKKLKKFQK